MTKKSAVETAAPSAVARPSWFVDPKELTIVGHDTDDGPEHPLYDERVKLLSFGDVELDEADEAMVLSIMEHGILEEVDVRKDGNKIEVVFGRRRTNNTRFANQRLVKQGKTPVKIPVGLLRGDDLAMMSLGVLENEHRRDDTMEVRAAKARRFLAKGKTVKQIAALFGKPSRTIEEWLSFFDMAPEVQAAVIAKEVPEQAAVELSRKPREQQKKVLAAVLDEVKARGAKSKRGKSKVTTQDIRNQDRRAAGKDDGITRSQLRKMVAHPDAGLLPEGMVDGWKIILGQMSPRAVKGVKAILDDVVAGVVPAKEAK